MQNVENIVLVQCYHNEKKNTKPVKLTILSPSIEVKKKVVIIDSIMGNENNMKVNPEKIPLETDQGILESEHNRWGLPLKDVYKYGLAFYKGIF